MTTISTEFDAAHRLPEVPFCSRTHGHRWRVSVSTGGNIEPFDLIDDLQAIARELQFRDLNEMMIGVVPDPPGIANWFLERLLMRWDKITAVEVWENPDYSVRVVREVH